MGSSFLDLFGGTGSVGIEALSRGAASCLFLDLAPQAVKTLKRNLTATHQEDKGIVRQMDAFQYLRSSSPQSFDYIFIAPPQYKELWLKTLSLIDLNTKLLSLDGWIIVQIDPVELADPPTFKSTRI